MGDDSDSLAKHERQPVDYGEFIEGIVDGTIILKGAMVTLTDDDMERMKRELLRLRDEYGANHIRLNTFPWDGLTRAEAAQLRPALSPDWRTPGHWLSSAPWEVTGHILKERWIPFFRDIGLGVILNLDAAAGNVFTKEDSWKDPALRAEYAEMVAAKARFFSDAEGVIGYDVLNEPIPLGSYEHSEKGQWIGWYWSGKRADMQQQDGSKILAEFYNDIIRRIREFDKERLIIVQPGPWGAATGFPQLLDVVDDERVIFSFHIYDPHWLSHNQLNAWKRKDTEALPNSNQEYPVTRNGIVFDRAFVDAIYAPAVDFMVERNKRTGRKNVMWIGELGSVRWVNEDAQRRWLEDVFALIDEQGWGWAYFLYAPWHVFWHPFTPFGDEGTGLDIGEYFGKWKEGDMEWFRQFDAKGPRESFRFVIEQMRAPQPK